MLEEMIEAGMHVVRLNFYHGDFTGHGAVIQKIKAASKKTGNRVGGLGCQSLEVCENPWIKRK
jgi:pyruvate kinase